MPSLTALSVDLNALAHNFHALEAIAGAPVHPVVKADGYGLGAVRVAQRLATEGARTFFVARAAGGEAVRRALGRGPIIYVLDGCVAGSEAALKASDLRPVINHGEQLAAWRAAGDGACGLQIDTGMNRLGFRPEEAPEPYPGLELVLSHLACADDPSEPMNRRQRDAFAAAAARYPGTVRSFANSGGVFLGRDYAFDAVRPGVSLYGGGPEGRPDPRLKAVATLTAEILQIREVPAGESVGYSRGYIASQPRRVALCGVGYADGVRRSFSPDGAVWLDGGLRPLLGRVSMDIIAVDVTGAQAATGDRVELFGPNRMLDDAATAAGTIAHELLSGLTARTPRTYVG